MWLCQPQSHLIPINKPQIFLHSFGALRDLSVRLTPARLEKSPLEIMVQLNSRFFTNQVLHEVFVFVKFCEGRKEKFIVNRENKPK